MHSDSGHLKSRTKIFHCPMSSGASEWAQRSARAKRAVRSKRTSERCQRTSERMSEWPSTYISISRAFESLCQEHFAFDVVLSNYCSCFADPNFGGIWGSALYWFPLFLRLRIRQHNAMPLFRSCVSSVLCTAVPLFIILVCSCRLIFFINDRKSFCQILPS